MKPRDRVTIRAVYEQHCELGRLLRSTLPATFDVMITPGHRVTYVLAKEGDPDGCWTGRYTYPPNHKDWRSFGTEYLPQVSKLLADRKATAFDLLCDKGDPHALK